jgi:hypothetical protein
VVAPSAAGGGLPAGQRRIYLLPTRFGLLLLVAAAVWVGALNYAVSLAYVLAFWIMVLLLAVLMAYRQLAGLQLQVEAGKGFCRAGCRLPSVADQSGWCGAANTSPGGRGWQHRTLPAGAMASSRSTFRCCSIAVAVMPIR